jgi:hypothetical protein
VIRRSMAVGLSCAVAVTVALFGVAGPAQATRGYFTSSIINDDSLARGGSLGVIHLWDGRYGSSGTAKYDYALPPGADTKDDLRWKEAAGYYLGPGYCAQIWRLNLNTDKWARWSSDAHAGQHQLPDGGPGFPNIWKINPYRC